MPQEDLKILGRQVGEPIVSEEEGKSHLPNLRAMIVAKSKGEALMPSEKFYYLSDGILEMSDTSIQPTITWSIHIVRPSEYSDGLFNVS